MCVKVIRADELLTPYSYLTWARLRGLVARGGRGGRQQVAQAGDRYERDDEALLKEDVIWMEVLLYRRCVREDDK